MQNYARAVVIGGGCVGVATLYGLALRGWSDSALLERRQLTTGSTWHAAGLIPSYARQRAVGRMIAKSIEIYEGLEALTGQSVGWHKCGQLRVANTRDRLDEFVSYIGVAEAQGIRARIVTPAEARDLWPLMQPSPEMLGALYHPDDGHIAPADVTQAMAKGARDLGAKIYTETEVTGFQRLPGGEWRITTNKGEITCEHFVLATGNYARQTGAMLGLEIPAIPIVHQYWVTEAVPEILARKRQGLPEMPILRDEGVAGYIREEGDGLMFGPYERTEHLKLFAEDGVPKWFGADLLPEDFDAVAANWEVAAERVPALARAGVKSNVRGPFQMTADELPLVGPAWGLRNVWLAEGVPGGILWGGALGHYLSGWIVDGDAGIDMSDIDARRFGRYANKAWTKQKVRQTWGTHADLHFPGEEYSAARPAKTSPAYDLLTRHGAVWGVLNGWEIANWYAPEGVKAEDDLSYRRTQHSRYVAEEVAAVRNAVGLVDISPMSKFEVSGPSATAWLDGLLANALPRIGRVALCHQLTAKGCVEAEYTVTRLADDRFYLISTPKAERLNFDMLSRRLPCEGGVTLSNVSDERGCLTVVGPRARDVLRELTETDLSNGAFPWLTAQTVEIGLASDVRMLRINYEGELGWELYPPMAYLRHITAEILRVGEGHGLRLVGLRALESLRLEKSYKAMHRDMNAEMTALESGLERFVKLDKGPFTGAAALRETALPRRLVTVAIETGEASVMANESVYHQGSLVGRLSSGGYSYHFGHDIGYALLPVELGKPGVELEVMVLGERRPARVVAEPIYDPKNERPRM